jgi:serine/threonine protein kinase
MNGYVVANNDIYLVKMSALNDMIRGLNNNAIENPLREIAAMQQLQREVNSPHLMHEIHSCVTDDYLFTIMPYNPPSPDLLHWFNTHHNNINVETIRRIIFQYAICVCHMHDAGYAHRDLSLENAIFIENQSIISSIDFGMLVLAYGNVPWYGKQAYSCPEVLTNFNIDPQFYDSRKADIYALGVILYMMLMREPLFRFDTPEGIQDWTTYVHALGFQQFIDLSRPHVNNQISADLLHLLNGMLAVNPDERFSINDVLEHPAFNNL